MLEIWNDLPDFIKAIGIFVFAIWLQIRQDRALIAEYKRNDEYPTPEKHQIRWHIRHIRSDVMLIAHLLMIIIVLLSIIAFK